MRRKGIFEVGHHLISLMGITLIVLMAAVGLIAISYQLAYSKAILPRVFISNIEVTNMTKELAKKRLEMAFGTSPNSVKITYRGEVLADSESLGTYHDFDWAVELAWGLGRSGNILTKVNDRLNMFFNPTESELPVKFDPDALDGIIARVTSKINMEGRSSRILLDKTGELKVEPGEDGLIVDEAKLTEMITGALRMPGEQVVEIPTVVKSSAINNSRITGALELANKWKDKKMRIYYKDFQKILSPEEIFLLIGLNDSPVNDDEITKLISAITPQVEVESKNAILRFENGKVVEFSPEIQGVKVDQDKFRLNLAMAITEGEKRELEVSVNTTEPKIKTGDINNLGIKTLIGTGTSKFQGSIPNRIHNLSLASSRLNGAIVAPGETFSLGNAIGDISRATGYKEAYVISQGRTVLGDGGGVCQVSTTLFRAALDAGLPIVERKAHAYRVHYYEDDTGPGLDATVFLPSADLRFINDTPGHILIQTSVDVKNVSMKYEIYGTDDGRVAKISPVKIHSQSPPRPTVYQDDPTLPVGTMKQVDWSAWGAKVSFDYKVTRGEEVLQDRTFTSIYQPWAAVYLRGTGQIASKQ